MMKTVHQTAIERRQELYGDRVAWLRRMYEIRALEDRVVELFYDGMVDGTTHTCQGQEAVFRRHRGCNTGQRHPGLHLPGARPRVGPRSYATSGSRRDRGPYLRHDGRSRRVDASI